MTFKVRERVSFPRNEHVDIHVSRVVLNDDDIESHQVDAIEIREWIKEPGLYGHGVVFPAHSIKDLRVALDQVTE